MPRYVTRSTAIRPRSDDDYWDQGPLVPSLSVDGPAEIDTGLVDEMGNGIFRLQPPIGFGRDEDW